MEVEDQAQAPIGADTEMAENSISPGGDQSGGTDIQESTLGCSSSVGAEALIDAFRDPSSEGEVEVEVADSTMVEGSYRPLTMEGIEEANLPFDIKLQILKEYIRIWATRIPLGRGRSKPTNRAYLYHDGLDYYAIPVHSSYDEDYEEAYDEWNGNETIHLIHNYYTRKYAEVSKILEVAANCSALYNPLRTFFFEHMIWQFKFAGQVTKLFYGTDRVASLPLYTVDHNLELEGIPEATRAEIKNISLCEPDGGWGQFGSLLGIMTDLITKWKAIRRLEFLELILESPLDFKKYTHISDDPDEEAFDKTQLVRFLVTKCYEIIKGMPDSKLKIYIRSGFYNISDEMRVVDAYVPADSDYVARIWTDYGRAERAILPTEYKGIFGYTQQDALDFYNGTSTLRDGLQSVEFEDVKRFRREYSNEELFAKIYWQMIFAEEWRKIWDQGLELSVEEGGYNRYDFVVGGDVFRDM